MHIRAAKESKIVQDKGREVEKVLEKGLKVKLRLRTRREVN